MREPSHAMRVAARAMAAMLMAAIASCAAYDVVAQEAAQPAPPVYRTYSFDDAMSGQLVRSIPLEVKFPADYGPLKLDPPINGVVWARRADLDVIASTKEVPRDAGLFHGRLTTGVGYDAAKRQFICGPDCGETDFKASIQAAGAADVQMDKYVVNGIPVLLLNISTGTMQGALKKKLYMAYVAVLIDTNVMLISYSPPADSKDAGAEDWQAFVSALTKGSNVLRPLGTAASAPAQASPPSAFADDLAQATRSETFRPTVDAFIAALTAGDADKSIGLVSPNLLNSAGRDTVQGVLRNQMLPFFAALKELGRSQTIARTGDGFGSEGFVFYLTMVPEQGEPRDFAVYVVEENGAKVVANILLDHNAFKASQH